MYGIRTYRQGNGENLAGDYETPSERKPRVRLKKKKRLSMRVTLVLKNPLPKKLSKRKSFWKIRMSLRTSMVGEFLYALTLVD